MSTKLYWVNGPWPGRLAISARPRGGDWLQGEIAAWREAGIGAVVSLLTSDEEQSLELVHEPLEARRRDMEFISIPISDGQVPAAPSTIAAALERINSDLSAGMNVVVHCRQGIGRSGLIAACLLITKGLSAGAAVDSVSSARGLPVPEN